MNKYFSLSIYKEKLRQTRTFGLVTTILFAVVSVFCILGPVLNRVGDKLNNTPQSLTVLDVNSLFVLMFTAIAPLMTVFAFRFTTNRAASDFYFSTPNTRPQIFFSSFLAVLSWCFIAVALSTLLPIILYYIFHKYIILSVSGMLLFSLQVIVSSFYIIAAVLIAISVTGTSISSIFVALMIIFIPRVLIVAIYNIGVSSIPLASPDQCFILLSSGINLPVGFIKSMGCFKEGFAPIIYTFILGVVYLILAGYLFNRRPSESAAKVAVSSKLRAIFRITIGVFINLFAVLIIFGFYDNNNITSGYISSAILSIVGIVLLSFGAYSVYELIATKSGKAMVKAMPMYLVVIAATGIILLFSYAVRSAVINYTPRADEIDSISLASDTENDYNYNDYFGDMVENVEIKDKKITAIVADTLKENIKAYKKDADLFYDNYMQNGKYPCVRVKIRSGLFSRYRLIYMEDSAYNSFNEIISANKDIQNVYLNFPDTSHAEISVDIASDVLLTSDSCKQIYECYKKDIESGNVTSEELLKDYGKDDDSSCFTIYVDFSAGFKTYELSLPVNEKYKFAVNKYYSLISKTNKIGAKHQTISYSNGAFSNFDVDISGVLPGYCVDTENITEMTTMFNMLKTAKTIGIKDGMYVISVTDYLGGNDDSIPSKVYYALSEEGLNTLTKIAKKEK